MLYPKGRHLLRPSDYGGQARSSVAYTSGQIMLTALFGLRKKEETNLSLGEFVKAEI